MDGSMRQFMNLAVGFYVLSMVTEAAGFALCVSNRRLSRWTILAACGFAGMFAAGALVRLASAFWGNTNTILLGLAYPVGGFLGFVARVTVVAGLALTFADFRGRLALALEPPHARR